MAGSAAGAASAPRPFCLLGFWRRREVVGRALLTPEPGRGTTSLVVSLGSLQEEGMKRDEKPSALALPRRGSCSCSWLAVILQEPMPRGGNQYAQQLLPFLGTLSFRGCGVEGIRPSSQGRRIASRGWLVIFVPFVARTISPLLLVGAQEPL